MLAMTAASMSTEPHSDDPSRPDTTAAQGPADVPPTPPVPLAGEMPTELAAALIERLAGPVLLLSTGGRLIAANRAAARLLGMDGAAAAAAAAAAGDAAGAGDAAAATDAAAHHASDPAASHGVHGVTPNDPSGLLDFGPSGLPPMVGPVPAEAVVAAVVAYASRPATGTRRITARIRHGAHAGQEVAAIIEPLTGTEGRPLAALLQFDLAAVASAAPRTVPVLRSAGSGRAADAASDLDPLTGLPRRVQAERQLALAIDRARVDGGALVLFRARLSGLPSIRGLHGRDAADEVVRTIAQRLATVLRGGDLVARMDVDEFVVAAMLGQESDAVAVAAKVERALGAPIRVAHGIASVRPCVGAALWPRDGQTHGALLSRAALVGKLSGR